MRSPLLWAGAGVVLASGIFAAVLGLSRPSPQPPTPSPLVANSVGPIIVTGLVAPVTTAESPSEGREPESIPAPDTLSPPGPAFESSAAAPPSEWSGPPRPRKAPFDKW